MHVGHGLGGFVGIIDTYDESRSMVDWTGTYRRRRTGPLVPLESVRGVELANRGYNRMMDRGWEVDDGERREGDPYRRGRRSVCLGVRASLLYRFREGYGEVVL